MKKQTFTAADFQRKPYAKPQINVVEISEADIICTSTAAFSVDGDPFGEEVDW